MEAAGFCSIERVSSLNIGFTNGKEVFSDSSDLTFKGHLLSLNMVAKVCPIDKPGIAFDKFNINHNAFPYYGDRVDDYPEEMRRNFINTEGLYYG